MQIKKHSFQSSCYNWNAKLIFDNLKETDGGEETFMVSKGWFIRFKSRGNCRSVKLSGESASADVEVVVASPNEFKG